MECLLIIFPIGSGGFVRVIFDVYMVVMHVFVK